jgi:MFS family permease
MASRALIKETLAQPYVKRLWMARFISNFGNGLSPVALAFGILHLKNGSSSELGTVLAFTTLMLICTAPFGGVIADRFGKVRTVGTADIVGSLFLLFQAAYFATGHVPLAVLLIINGVFGMLNGIWWPAFSGVLPSLLPDHLLQVGNSLQQLISNTALIMGSASAGFLVNAYGSALPLTVDAITFLIAGIVVFSFRRVTAVDKAHTNSVFKDLKEGWVITWSIKWIIVILAGFAFLIGFASMGIDVLGPVIFSHKHDGPKLWAFVLSLQSIGLILGSLIGMRVRPKHPMRFVTMLTYSIAIYLLLLASNAPVLVIALGAFAWGIVGDLWGTMWWTALQKMVDKDALARVSSYDAIGSLMFRPVGLAVAAPVAAWVGVRGAVYIAAGGAFLSITGMLLSKEVRNMSFSEDK